MSNIPSRGILESISGFTQSASGSKQSADRPVKIATVEPYYTSGLARVQFDGETTLSGKGYTWSNNYSPRGGDRVYLVPVGQSYIIAGKLASSVPTPLFYDFELANGWQPYTFSTIYYAPQVTRTASGVVKLRGLISGGTRAQNLPIGYLPEPFRPLVAHHFPSLMNDGAAGFRVDPNGAIYIAQHTSNSSYATLDNITFNNNPDLAWNQHTLINSWTNFSSDYDAAWVRDDLGRVWNRGTIARSAAPASNSAVHNTLPADSRPQFEIHIPTYGATAGSYLDVTSAGGQIRWKTGSGSSSLWSLDSAMYPSSTAASFTNMPYGNGWVSNSSTHPPASYWKDSDGIVHVRGLARAGVMGRAIANLPPGFRPGKRVLRYAVSGDAPARVDITTDGDIIPSLASNVWFSLDGINFVAEQ